MLEEPKQILAGIEHTVFELKTIGSPYAIEAICIPLY